MHSTLIHTPELLISFLLKLAWTQERLDVGSSQGTISCCQKWEGICISHTRKEGGRMARPSVQSPEGLLKRHLQPEPRAIWNALHLSLHLRLQCCVNVLTEYKWNGFQTTWTASTGITSSCQWPAKVVLRAGFRARGTDAFRLS